MPKIKIEDIVIDSSIYPREKTNTHLIGSYADSIMAGDEFPPIAIEKKTNRLLDGLHRLKAHEKYAEEYEKIENKNGCPPPQTELEAQFLTIPDGIPAKLYAASFSVDHGNRIAPSERRNIAREIYEENLDFGVTPLAKYLGVSTSTAYNYVADLIAMQREAKRNTAYRLHRLGWTQEEIGEAIGIVHSNVHEILSEFPELEKQTKSLIASGLPVNEVAKRFNLTPLLTWSIALDGKNDQERLGEKGLDIKIQPYDVWNFATCHNLFGDDHPGRIPGQIVAQTLYFFTNPKDVVIDPMSGSGTTQDVCLAMGRGCYGYDIDLRHKRPDILKHDMATDWPKRIKKADLIFWDAPYFEKMDKKNIGKEGYIEGSISNFPRDEYLKFFSNRLSEAKELVKKGTKLAFLMSDWDDNTGKRDGIFIWDYANLILESGWKLIRHIQVPITTQQVHPDIVNKFRESKRLARLERYLLIAEA